MNFNEYKPTPEKGSDIATNVSCICAVITVCAILFFAMKLACWLDHCAMVGM